jgi:transcriptional regulator with XRE-family HTH domain
MSTTTEERLLLARRRAGLSQRAAAAKIGCTARFYEQVEGGARPPGRYFVSLAELSLGVEVRSLRPTAPERLLLARRRRGWTQGRVARALRRSRRWVMLVESNRARPTRAMRELLA